MKSLFIWVSLFSVSAYGSISTTISHLEAPTGRGENYEVFANNGRVYEVSSSDNYHIEDLKTAIKTGREVSLELEEGVPFSTEISERITWLEVNEAPELPQEDLNPMTNFAPSNVESLENAQEMFDNLKDRTKWFTQCFHRAHIWARQMHKDYNVESQKILIFYSKKYRKEVDGKWWFHIAPMITVNGQKYVMDKEFTNTPVTDEKWESIFTQKMKTKKIGPEGYRCGKIQNISSYYSEQNPEYCNILHTSMFYWQPYEMLNLEKKGTQKTKWVNWELRVAAKGAWFGWRDLYKEYKVTEANN